MYNPGRIIISLVIFVGLMLFAFIYNIGNDKKPPELAKPPAQYENCVKPVKEIRESHMVLLNEWRDEVIREGNRKKVEIDGKFYEKSLQNGCLHCHKEKKKFCDRCHVYASVRPYCWDCHFDPSAVDKTFTPSAQGSEEKASTSHEEVH